MTTDELIDGILRREGGYVDHPNDQGHATNYGITQRTLEDYRGRRCTRDELKRLTREEAREIYRRLYVEAPGYTRIPDDRLRALVVDCGVLHGPGRATRWLQEALGVTPDGVMGKVTEAAMKGANLANVYRLVFQRRLRFIGEIVQKDQTQLVFLAGWLSRAGEFCI